MYVARCIPLPHHLRMCSDGVWLLNMLLGLLHTFNWGAVKQAVRSTEALCFQHQPRAHQNCSNALLPQFGRGRRSHRVDHVVLFAIRSCCAAVGPDFSAVRFTAIEPNTIYWSNTLSFSYLCFCYEVWSKLDYLYGEIFFPSTRWRI